jgi:hypothetical protein
MTMCTCFRCGKRVKNEDAMSIKAWWGDTMYEPVRICWECYLLLRRGGMDRLERDDRVYQLDPTTPPKRGG